mmetsp:Transcript_20575/g.29831  ORF Transcript_20575/g.29831 Transcript_20575/m.29831 type:complete len:103 (-) Transcript_20575:243-551(-)
MEEINEEGKLTLLLNANNAPFEPYHGKPVVTMTGLGELRPFGTSCCNAFLRIAADFQWVLVVRFVQLQQGVINASFRLSPCCAAQFIHGTIYSSTSLQCSHP